MSAWDVAGAVVWSSLAVLFWAAVAKVRMRGDNEAMTLGFHISTLLTLAAVFCIARLFGAHP